MIEPTEEDQVVSDHFTDPGPILTGVCSLLWQVVPPETLDRALDSELKGLRNDMRREYKRLREEAGLPV